MKIPFYSIRVPEYKVDKKRDWKEIGSKIDAKIKKHFFGKRIGVRCLSSKDHGKPLKELIKLIRKHGTDRYNPKIKGDRYENLECKNIDLFALDFKVSKKSAIMEKFIEPFYTWPLKFGRKPIRLDLIVIYDRKKLKAVYHRYEGREKEIKRDGFVFKEPENKRAALLGMIEIGK
jgi:hypothetical protein